MWIRSTISNHPLATALAALATAGAIAFVLVFFEPQALLIDDEVSEAVPTLQPASAQKTERRAEPKVLGSGEFIGIEGHSAAGTARLLELDDETRFVRFESDFDVTNGPDLRVYLSAAPPDASADSYDDEFVDLGELKGNVGSQNYRLPAEADPQRYRSAVVWCKRFSVGFAAAGIG